MTATWLAATLRNAGLTVHEAPRWTARGGTQFAPKGVMIHHTATGPNWSRERLTKLLVEGRPDLKGPLCNLQLDRDGSFTTIAAGRANHAGAGSWSGITNGNNTFVGIEAANDGVGERWPQVQVEAMGVGVAAILKAVGSSPLMVVGHKEWAPRRKVDPRGIDMDMFRRYVGNLVGATISNDIVVKDVNMAKVPDVRRGQNGDWVRRVQGLLVAGGFLPVQGNLDKDGRFDGAFGPLVEAAVKRAQQKGGLAMSGVVNKGTWEFLLGV